MEVQKYVEKQKDLYCLLYNYIIAEDSSSFDDLYNNLIDFYKTLESSYYGEKLPSFLILLNSMTEHHHRDLYLYDKISKILLFLSNSIKQTLSNLDLFQIFGNNKLILLFLLHNEIAAIDDSVVKFISERGYTTFFNPELTKFFSQKVDEKPYCFFANESNEIPNFEENRQIGENESYLCMLIRQDSVEDFISYVNKENINLSKTKIENNSIFETNCFFL